MKKLFLLSVCAAAAVPAIPTFAVGTSNWTHTTEADFKGGKFDNVVATNLGDLKLSRATRMLLQQNPKVSSVNSMVQAPDGTIYAGTGPHGQILKIVKDTVTELATIEGATHIFALAFDKEGALLIGASGERGRILKMAKPGDQPVEVFKADGVQYVWSIAQTEDDGRLYAATGPNGQLFEISAPGQNRVVLDADENNLLSLISDGKDFLYVGTDPNGLVYRVNRRTNESFIVYDAPEAEISALVMDKAGNVYAGTAEARDEPPVPRTQPVAPVAGRPESQPAGTPIPSKPPTDPEPPKVPDPNPGQPEPIPKATPATPEKSSEQPSAQNEPTAALSAETPRHGNAWVSPADTPHAPVTLQNEPTGNEPPADVKSLMERVKAMRDRAAAAGQTNPRPGQRQQVPPPGGPRPAGAGMVPGRPPTVDANAAGQAKPEGNAIYRIDTDGFVTEVFRQRALVLAMAEKEGVLFVATGNEGLVYQVSPALEETSVVAKVDPKHVTTLLPAKDGNLYLGLSNVGGIATIGSGYASTGTYTSTVLDATQISRFGKIQLHGTLPTGTTLAVSTRSGNVKDATQTSWSKWSDPVPAAEYIQVPSPTARFLQYRLTFTSNDGGKTTPVVEDVGIAYQIPNLPPQVKSIRVTAQPEQQPPQPPGTEAEPVRIARSFRQQIAWEASDANGDNVLYSLHFRRGPAAPWILLRDNLQTAQFDWDTRSVADGRYEIRVTANDARSNPPGKGRSGARVSDPMQVDNTAPIIGSVKWQQAGPAVQVDLKVIDRSSIVASLDYSINSSKGWQAVLPSDNIFDSPDEPVSFAVPGLPPGAHQITVRATDAKGNQAFETVQVNVDGPTAVNDQQ